MSKISGRDGKAIHTGDLLLVDVGCQGILSPMRVLVITTKEDGALLKLQNPYSKIVRTFGLAEVEQNLGAITQHEYYRQYINEGHGLPNTWADARPLVEAWLNSLERRTRRRNP